MILVALAGVSMNFILLVLGILVSVVLFRINPLILENDAISMFLEFFLIHNVVLIIFNLVPIPPLDGSHIWTTLLARHIPRSLYEYLQRYGIWILAILVFSGVLRPVYDFFLDQVFRLVSFLALL